MINYLIQKDQELLIFLNNLGNTQWDSFWLFMTDKKLSIVFYLLVLSLFWKKNWKFILSVFIIGILLVTLSDQIANFFKAIFKRLRPFQNENILPQIRAVKTWNGVAYSFYSAHASTGMALAIYFGLLLKQINKNLIYPILLFAVLVGYSRIYLGVHFPLDVSVGFLIGGILGYLIYKLHCTFTKKYLV